MPVPLNAADSSQVCLLARLPRQVYPALCSTHSLLIWTNIFASTCLLPSQFQHACCMKSYAARELWCNVLMTWQNYSTAKPTYTYQKERFQWNKSHDSPWINTTSLPQHLDCSWAVSYDSSVFQAHGYADQIGTCCYNLPVYGEHHFLYAPLDLVLCFQVSHGLCRLSVDGQDHVSHTQVGLGSFTPRGDLQHRTDTDTEQI